MGWAMNLGSARAAPSGKGRAADNCLRWRHAGPGRDAAHALVERAHGLGLQMGILDPRTGADFNDILTRKAVAA
jgi:hypothetical protein